ncbi:MoaD/ThiS family protein [Chloroflexota bacterium]
MSVKVNVYYFLPHLTDDREEIEVNGSTIGECFEKMMSRFPKAREWLFGKDGRISNFVDIYVNLEMVDPDELSRQVNDGDVIHIVMMLTGG